jgi:hypothetical protein
MGPRNSGKRFKFRLRKCGNNQQDGIGAVGARFQDLNLVNDEIFA